MTSDLSVREAVLQFLLINPYFSGHLAVLFDHRKPGGIWRRARTLCEVSWDGDQPILDFFKDFCTGQTETRNITVTPLEIPLEWFDMFP